MTLYMIFAFAFLYGFTTILNATPIDLGSAGQSILDNSPTIAILIYVIYNMRNDKTKSDEKAEGQMKSSESMYLRLREEDKKEAAAEKEELLAAFSKIEEREKESMRLHQERVEIIMNSHQNTIKALLESQDKKEEKQFAMKHRLLDENKAKDTEIVNAYKQNLSSQEKLGEAFKGIGEANAEILGKVLHAIETKFEQMIHLVKK